MAQRSIDITQISAGTGNNGNTLVVQGNSFVFAASGASSSFTGTTSDVPEGANLYFTSARALTAINGFINTSNVIESPLNLYYTNTRVLDAVQNNITTTSVLEGANLYFTNTRAIVAVKDNITTSNVIEGSNLYFTNARAVASLTAGAGIDINANGLLTITAAFSGNTSVIPEGANLYFTSARAIAAVKDNISTSNVTEGSNLYFTNTRAIYALTAGDNITISGTGTIAAISQAFTGNTNAIPEGSANLYFTNTRVLAAVKDNINTSNVIEGSNLYFTSARAVTAVKDNINTSNVIEGANLYFTNARALAAVQNNISTTFVTEGANLYFTNTRAISAFTAGQNITIASDGTITGASQAFTGNTNFVPEGSANLYFTNTRVVSALNAGQNITIAANGLVATTHDQTIGGNLYVMGTGRIGGNLTIEGNIYVTGNVAAISVLNLKVTDNMIYLNSNSTVTNPDLGFAANYNDGTYAHTGLFRDATDGKYKFFEGYTLEPDADLYINTAHPSFRFANLEARTFFGDGTGITGINASQIVENGTATTGNVFFTNTRAISALTAGQNITISSTGTITGASQAFTGNTNAVPEGSANLYFTSARAIAAVKDNITTSNVIEGANLYFTNTRAIYALTAGTGISISGTGTITSTAGFTGNTNAVPEGSANLYFTNTRAISALTAGSGIDIAANGLVSVNTLTIIDSETFFGSNANLTMATSITNAKNIIVVIDGLVQIPNIDYTVLGTALRLSSNTAANTTVEVKYYGNDAISTSSLNPFLLAGL